MRKSLPCLVIWLAASPVFAAFVASAAEKKDVGRVNLSVPAAEATPAANRIAFAAMKPLPLGSITARGWLKDQLQRNRDGLGGHLDELEPQMMGTPYTTRESYKGWGASTPGWGAEISGNYWQGVVALAWTLDDAGLKAKATRWVEAVLNNAEPSGYLGTYKPTDYQVPLQTVTRPLPVTLVPYGCTALRISCFPRCDAARLRPDLSFRP